MRPDVQHLSLIQPSAVHEALKRWSKAASQSDDKPGPLQHLHIVQQQKVNGVPWRQANRATLELALNTLAKDDADAADILRARFRDGKTVQELARQYSIADSTFSRHQAAAITRLTETIQMLEVAARATQQQSLATHLPAPSYTQLFGIDDCLTSLRTQLGQPGSPWLIALHGMGGIGKTALADVLLRQMVGAGAAFHVGWVTAKAQIFNLGGSLSPIDAPILTADALVDELVAQLVTHNQTGHTFSGVEGLNALRHRLKEQPHLIVIDKLETITELQTLLPLLHDLANPSRFILTTRESLFVDAAIFHFSVPELSLADALRLMRHEAEMRNLAGVIVAPDEELAPVYGTVGGNPLALRLVIGQLHVHDLTTLLHDLHAAQGETSANLYTFLYRQAWESLDAPTRDVFLAMPLVPPHGEDLAAIQEICGVAPTALRHALQLLVKRNLVDVRGSFQHRLYTIHSLTRTFLQQQVAQWSSS
ncbi:MAG: NB-ARC domain-containing protein [Caldilineaceae bacterium]